MRQVGSNPVKTTIQADPQKDSQSAPPQEGKVEGRSVKELKALFEPPASDTPTSTGLPAPQGTEVVRRERSVRVTPPLPLGLDTREPTKGPSTDTQVKVPANPEKTDYEKKVQQFGSKTANLYEIEKLGVKVPGRSPVSSEEVLAFLLEKDPDKVIETAWQTMQENKAVDAQSLEAITDKIEEIFDEGFPFTEDQLNWINVTMVGKVLIARSTGDEDSADTPNAGGNESVLFVEPTPASVGKAMKEVVLSYFGEESLRNRMVGENVESVLGKLPKMPVLLMEMIAEPILDPKRPDPGGKPPIGIAMSTDKVEFTGGEGFHFVSISSAVGPGVNEGSGRVEVDETFVMQSSDGTPLLVYQKPAVKPERIRAVKEGEAVVHQLQKNSIQQAYGPSLSREQVTALVIDSNKIKSLNGGKTTEVEAVVDGEGKVNFVQQRPIPDVRSKLEPTYVGKDVAQGHAKTFSYTTVVPKSGDALVITDWSQVCFAETMKEAEAMFDWKGGSQKLVIVRRPDASNSHPAVNFGSYKTTGETGLKEPNPIPCLVVPEFGELLALKKSALSAQQPLVIDGQTQQAFVWTDTSFDPSTAVVKGRIAHHIGLDTGEVAKKAPELFDGLKTTPSAQMGTLKPALDKLLDDYGQRLGQLEAQLRDHPDTLHNVEGLTLQLQTTRGNFEAVKEAFGKVLEGDARHTFEPGSHARLLLVKFLESALHEVDHFPKLIEAESSASRYLQAIKGSPVKQPVFGSEVLAVKDGLTGPLMLRWKRFLTLAEQSGLSPTQINDFKAMMTELGRLGVTASWMSTVFDTRYAELMPTGRSTTPVAPKAKQLLETLVREFTDTAPFLQKQQALQKQLDEVERGMADFASETRHAAAFIRLKGVVDAFTKDPWPTDLDDNPLKKAVQIQTLGRLVEVYDRSIKTLKGNPMNAPDLLKTELGMLDTFAGLFKSLFTGIQLPGHNPVSKLKYGQDLDLAFDKIKKDVAKTAPERLLESQMICKPEFNVLVCLYSTQGKVMPGNVEEMFTTLHQNLEEIRSGLMVGGDDYAVDLPEPMHKLLSAVPKLAMQTASNVPTQLVGKEITSSGVTYVYNMPVLDHGIKVKATCEKPTETHPQGRTMLEVDFYASNEGGRLQQMATLANLFRFGSEPVDDPGRREVTWGDKQMKARFEIRGDEDIGRVTTLINNLCAYSLAPNRDIGGPKNSRALPVLVGRTADPTSGEFPSQRIGSLNDALNVAFGSVVGKPGGSGPVVLGSTDYKVELVPSKTLTFNDGVRDHVLRLDQPSLGLDPSVFNPHADELRRLVGDEVMVGSLKFSFESKGKRYVLDLNRADLGLDAAALKSLSLAPKNLARLGSHLKAAWENALFRVPRLPSTQFGAMWAEALFGPAWDGSKGNPMGELALWKQASAVEGKRGPLVEVDKALERVIEKKRALQDVEARLAQLGSFATADDKLALKRALGAYHQELMKCEGVCSGYIGMQHDVEAPFDPRNAFGRVKSLGQQAMVQRRSIENQMQLLGMTPVRLTAVESGKLPFSATRGHFPGYRPGADIA